MAYGEAVSIVVYPGSFDPFTLGHLDVVRRTHALFDEVVVAVAQNPDKNGLLPAAIRIELIRAAIAEAGLTDVRVEAVPGLIVDFCAQIGATAIVKGLRGGADFDAEASMALMNRKLTGIETVFLQADPAFAHIASSLVKDIARHGGDITDLVPAGVADAVRAALSR